MQIEQKLTGGKFCEDQPEGLDLVQKKKPRPIFVDLGQKQQRKQHVTKNQKRDLVSSLVTRPWKLDNNKFGLRPPYYYLI